MTCKNDDSFDNDDDAAMHFALFVNCDLLSYEKAASNNWWVQAMDEEIHAIEKNNTWKLTILPRDKKPIVSSRWTSQSTSQMER